MKSDINTRPDSLLTESVRNKIKLLISKGELDEVVKILQKYSTAHAGTAKTKDKKFVISQILKHVNANFSGNQKHFFDIGKRLSESDNDNAKEIGVSMIWRGYAQAPVAAEEILLKIADDSNWEVREYAGIAFANALNQNPKLHSKMMKWSGHDSENVRRAVVFSSLAYKEKGDIAKAFEILRPLMRDSSKYVRKNLGPFILGSHFGNNFPSQTLQFLELMSNEEDPNVLWNVAMSFNNSFGNRYPEKSLKILSQIAQSENISVRRAIISTLRHLHKRHSDLINDFCREYNLSIKKAPSKRGG